MVKDNICVIVPVHSANPSSTELKSLRQCAAILRGYDVFLIFPSKIDVTLYKREYEKLILCPVNENWLSSIENYNKMKCSLEFYNLFKKYSYLLTYELDSFIFSDDWDTANVFDYDYIGAPWFHNNNKIGGVGNSGFSFRNVKQCIAVLEAINGVRKIWSVFSKLHLHRLFKLTILLNLVNPIWNKKGKNINFYRLLSSDHLNEDLFWSYIIPDLFNFKVAPLKDAIKFSFELNPSELFKLNNSRLPLGCHAWNKYDPEFWIPFIP